MPHPTLREQQETIRFIEVDKALPDKYRFLLFDGKHEVGKKAPRHLVWK